MQPFLRACYVDGKYSRQHADYSYVGKPGLIRASPLRQPVSSNPWERLGRASGTLLDNRHQARRWRINDVSSGVQVKRNGRD